MKGRKSFELYHLRPFITGTLKCLSTCTLAICYDQDPSGNLHLYNTNTCLYRFWSNKDSYAATSFVRFKEYVSFNVLLSLHSTILSIHLKQNIQTYIFQILFSKKLKINVLKLNYTTTKNWGSFLKRDMLATQQKFVTFNLYICSKIHVKKFKYNNIINKLDAPLCHVQDGNTVVPGILTLL